MLLEAIGIKSRRKGRPTDAENQRKRSAQIRVVALVLLGNLTAAEAARVAGVAESTIWSWRRRLLSDGRPDTDDLRAVANRPANP
jgi:transposase-like protein